MQGQCLHVSLLTSHSHDCGEGRMMLACCNAPTASNSMMSPACVCIHVHAGMRVGVPVHTCVVMGPLPEPLPHVMTSEAKTDQGSQCFWPMFCPAHRQLSHVAPPCTWAAAAPPLGALASPVMRGHNEGQRPSWDMQGTGPSALPQECCRCWRLWPWL